MTIQTGAIQPGPPTPRVDVGVSSSVGSAGLTESQRARRERMLSAAAELALDGGWDAVQMREVATRADVALGTLYRYFPSKEHLLVSVMLGEVESLADRLSVRPPEGADPMDRVIDVLARANRNLQRQPSVTYAMIRALVSGNQEVAPVVSATRAVMRRIISDALGHDGQVDGTAGDRDVLAIDLLSDVWLAVLVSWISGVEPAESVAAKLESATRILLV